MRLHAVDRPLELVLLRLRAGLAKLLFNGVALGAGSYSTVIDNDCDPLVIASIADPSCGGGTPARDTNETAIVTAWATTTNGQGRARVRAVLGIDNPWKHVCSNSSQDNPPGYCNEPANRNGNPSIVPADPNEYPGGPAAYDDLPRPQLGCSAIDPLRSTSRRWATARPARTTAHPYPVGKRLVVQGDRQQGQLRHLRWLTITGATSIVPSRRPASRPPAAPLRKACVPRRRPRRLADTGRYHDVGAGGCGANTGMVFVGSVSRNNDGDIGAAGNGRNMYVMNGTFSIQRDDFHGVIVVEGDGGGGDDLQHRNQARIWTEQTNTTHGRPVYGYPLAYLDL